MVCTVTWTRRCTTPTCFSTRWSGGARRCASTRLRSRDAARRRAADERRLLPAGDRETRASRRSTRPTGRRCAHSRGRALAAAAAAREADPRRSARGGRRTLHGAPATDETYRGAVVLVDELAPFALGEQRGVVVRVANGARTSAARWSRVARDPVTEQAARRTAPSSSRRLRTPLPAVLPPGGSSIVPAMSWVFVAGQHTLVLDLLHEHVRGPGARPRHRWRCGPRSASRSSVRRDAATAAAAALAEIAPSVRPLLLSASPGGRPTSTATAPRRTRGVPSDAEGEGWCARRRVRARGGPRSWATPRCSARGAGTVRRPAGDGEIPTLNCADALLVVGGDALRGGRGPREALQVRAAILAARTLGLERPPLTGGLGFIGSALGRRPGGPGRQGHPGGQPDSRSGGNAFNVHDIRERVTVNVADVRDFFSSCEPGVKDVLFNLAGQTSHIDSMLDPFTDLEINCRRAALHLGGVPHVITPL